MILLLGASGYIGSAFASALDSREIPYLAASRAKQDYTDPDQLRKILETARPEFAINAAGYTGKPNVDACETAREETLHGNVELPRMLGEAFAARGIPWAHVSSGCIYDGAKFSANGKTEIVKDLTAVRDQLAATPESFAGFTETDEPNFSFDHPPCSFYSGSKAQAEKELQKFDQVYVMRLRIPFDEQDSPRNYLSKLLRYPKIYDNANSLSHRMDFVNATIDLWRKRAPFGFYNATNPGFVTTRDVIRKIREKLHPEREFEFWENDEEFYREAAQAPRSNCLLDSSKLLNAGVSMRPVDDALDDALANWRPENPNA